MSTTFPPGLDRTACEETEAHRRRVLEALFLCARHAQHGLRWWDADTVRSILMLMKSFDTRLRPLVTHLVSPHLDGVDTLPNLKDLTLNTKLSQGFKALPRLLVHNLQPLTGLKAITRLCLANTMVNDIGVLAGHTALRVLCLAECQGISDLKPLRGLSLQHLDLSSTSVASITPLAHMSSLEVLRLSNGPLSRLTPHLPGLQELDLESTKIVNITPLAAMSNLRTLSLEDLSRVQDFAPIAELHNLHSLNLLQSNFAQEHVLSGLSRLRVLKLGSSGGPDLGPLQDLQLEELHVYCAGVLDLGPLASLRGLRCLHISWCYELENASVLTRLTRLETLHVSAALCDEDLDVVPHLPLTLAKLHLGDVQDLSGVSHLQNLHTLSFMLEPSSDDESSPDDEPSPVECSIKPLAQLTSLKWLLLRETPVNDLRPLRGLPLERLDLSKTEVTDLSPLADTLTLTQLACSECSGLLDVSALNRLSRLSSLDLSYSSAHDLQPLSRLPLQHLFLAATQVHDLSPLQAVHTLVCLDISGTPVQDLSPLADLTNLELLKASDCPAGGALPRAMKSLRGHLVEERIMYTPYPTLDFDSPVWFYALERGDWLHRDLLTGRDWTAR